MRAASPFITAEEAADRLRFTVTAPANPVKAFHQWRYRHARGVKTYRRGATTLYKQSELDAALDVQRPVALKKASGF